MEDAIIRMIRSNKIEELANYLEELREQRDFYCSRNIKLETKIREAIEYIEHNSLFEENEGKDFEYSVANDNKATKNLLSILKCEKLETMRVIDLLLLYDCEVPSNIKIEYKYIIYTIDELLAYYRFTDIMNEYVNVIYEGGE